MHFLICFVFCFLKLFVESTDIAAVYHQGILLLKDANKISSTSMPLKAEALQVDLEHKLGFPIALTFDPLQRRIFVADSKASETQLFSLAIEESPVKIRPLLTESHSSVVDGLVYGPLENTLFWTDASRHGIYSGNLSDLSKGPALLTDRNVNKPRGITFDHCKKALYWTEREDERSSIERYDLKQKTQVSLAVGINHTYYQTVDYNIQTKEIIWAESVGSTVVDSSCRFVAKSLETGNENTLASFENCFPFALTSDKDHIYWSDWNKEGIMRFSRRDPKHSLIKLVETPEISIDSQYRGAYGIVNLLKMSPDAEVCINQKIHDDASIVSEVTESDVQGTVGDLGSKVGDSIPVHANESPISTTFHSEKENIFVPSASTSQIDFKETSIYRQQRFLIIGLAIVCSFFMISTMILLYRLCLEFKIFKLVKRICSNSPSTTENYLAPKKSKQHRRFKPNQKFLEGQLCQKNADDGVKIDIEDCCQMTLCDTPCFTSVKKEGKAYKEPRSPRKANDKKKLLDDYETA